MNRADRPSRVLVVGLGNPILGDDGVGWRVAAEVQKMDSSIGRHVEVDFSSVGGLALMERILGYEQVVLIDAAQTGEYPVGSVVLHALEDLPNPKAGHTTSAHDASLATSLLMARDMGETVPGRVDIVTIEIGSANEFSESLTPAVAGAVETATETVLTVLRT